MKATPKLRFFDAKTAAVFQAVAARIAPRDPAGREEAPDGALEIVDAAIADRGEELQKNVRLFLKVIQFAPVLRYGRAFLALDPPRRDAVLRFFANNRKIEKFRQGFWGVKTFALMGRYGTEDCWEELGYPGPRMDAPYYKQATGDGKSD